MSANRSTGVEKRNVMVTGLPRAGSTLVCQLLSHHPDLYCPGNSSPLAHLLGNMRSQVSNDAFLLSQLDTNYDQVYRRLLNTYRGMINGWFEECSEAVVVDKNRAWLGMIDIASVIDPECRFVVCLRELGQLFGSIEVQHQKTVLLDSSDNTAGMTPYGRATAYFKDGGLVASCLSNIESSIEDLSESLRSRIYYLKYEGLMANPLATMQQLSEFLQLPLFEFDPNNLRTLAGEADSHYRYKFTHTTHDHLRPASEYRIPERTRLGLIGQHNWFYRVFYPHLLSE
jgi:sulfotransferase